MLLHICFGAAAARNAPPSVQRMLPCLNVWLRFCLFSVRFVVVLPASSLFSLLIKKQKPSLDDLNGAASAEIQSVLYFWALLPQHIRSLNLAGCISYALTHTDAHIDAHVLSAAAYGIAWQDYGGKLSNRFPVIARTRKLNACSACQLSGN